MAEATEKYQQAGPKVQPSAKEEMVYTWPYLVSIEAIMAICMIFALTIMSTFVNAPLLDLANTDKTPNPAKAPWYFLALQELLLHMNPALAGVIVPTVALVGLGMIPYIDRDRRGTGIWFSTKKGPKIAIFAAVYTGVINLSLILFDEFFHMTGMPAGSHGLGPLINMFFKTVWVDGAGRPVIEFHGLMEALTGKAVALIPLTTWGEIFVPTVMMVAIPWILVVLIKKIFKANTREVMIGMYSFFLMSFLVLTIVGTFFRGESMHLMAPWNVKAPH